jgi:two-component system LytT family sensor kinase
MTTRKPNFLTKIGAATIIALLFKLAFFRLTDFWNTDLLVIPFIILVLWEGNTFIDRQLDIKYSWLTKPKQRIMAQFVLSLLFTAVALFPLMNFIHFIRFHEVRLFNRAIQHLFVPAVITTFLGLVIYISSQFFKLWKQSLLEVERHKTESANAQLQNLKNQLNPHFLFNNLSVLASLVYKNQDKAVDFINELANVYRGVLENKNTELVSLKEELDFLAHYIYLLKIRFEDSISFSIKTDENTLAMRLPPMCLQTLIENTMQHNETSKTNPLEVLIYTENNHLIVENTLQARSDTTESTHTGLKNMQARFAFFTDEKIGIINDGKVFKVILPLI